MRKWKDILVLEYVRQDIIMKVIYCYFEKENCKALEFYMNNFTLSLK